MHEHLRAMFRRPSRTLLPGLGVASAVLAGVVVAFAVAAQLIGLELPARERADERADAVRIEDRREPVRITTARRPAPNARPSASGAATAAPRPRRRAVSQTTGIAQGEPESGPPQPPAPPPAAAAQEPQTPPPPPPPPATRPRAPLEPLGNTVDKATDDLSDTLRGLTEGLGEGVAPLSPELGQVLEDTGGAVGGIVEGTGNVLGQALGSTRAAR